MCLMLDQFLWGHSSHVCDISCFVHGRLITFFSHANFTVMAMCFVLFLEKISVIHYFYAPKELWEAYSNRTVRPSVPLRVRCISPIFFEVGIPNLVCGCILGWRSVVYHFRVTVTLTLTSDLVFIVIKCPSVRPASCLVQISYTL